MSDSSLPLFGPDEIDGERTPAAVHGVVLAAGTSSRYGAENKLLEPADGEPLVRHAARTLVASRTETVTVVVGHEADRVGAAVAELPVSVRENPEYETGQSTSVREGVRAAAAAGADAVLIALGDMPDVSPTTVDTLLAGYERGAGTAIAPAYDGRRGNPVLFDARFFDALADVSGDIGGREILRSAADAALIEVDDPGVARDVDTPADLER
jgi:molybdenum cofactor cytidylyltransferase